MMHDRPAHVAWCQMRALEYLDDGDLMNALASMGSDMAKRDDCRIAPHLYMAGVNLAMSRDVDGLRRWIKGFQ